MFQRLDPESFSYLEQVGRNDDRRGYEAALHSASRSWEFILIPRTEAFETRNGDELGWVFGSFAIGAGVWLIMVLVPRIHMSRAHTVQIPETSLFSEFKWLRFFLPRRETYALPLLIDLNLLVFATMAIAGPGFFSFSAQALLAWGANYRPAIHGFGVFRLVASQFVHGGIVHLVNNMYGLLFAGACLTRVLGNGKIIAAYLACGLCGSVASVAFHPATISVGASGAIFGLFGILLVLLVDCND